MNHVMRKVGLIGFLVCLLFIASLVYAQIETKPPTEKEKNITETLPPKKDCPSEEACALWEEFKAKYGPNWQVKWHQDRDSPQRIYGLYNLSKKIETKEDAESVAIEITNNTKDLFKINLSGIKFRRTLEDKWNFIPEYDQYYNNIPVYRGEIRIILSKKNEFEGITNSFYPNISISTKIELTKEEAIEIARNATNAPETAKPFNVTLTILPKEENGSLSYYLTWHVQIWATDVFVDAINGNVIEKFSIVPTSPSPQIPEPTAITPPEIAVTPSPTYQPEITEAPIITTSPSIQQPTNKETISNTWDYLSVKVGIIVLILLGVLGFILLKRRGK